MTALLVALRSATVSFGAKRALQGIELAVQVGERVAVVGANGSGKSSLLRAVHGLVPLHDGRRELADPAPRIAMLFQRPYMLRMSVLANVELGLKLQGIAHAPRHAQALQALQRVGLASQALRNARVLSAGQQQRAALARAWAMRPDLLLLDEPTASLDPTAKREVETLIEQFAAQGTTLLMSSHNLGQVKRLASRVLYLEHGRLLADVPTDAFFNGPLPAEAALFLKGELPWA
ncbi:MAG TPA: phosphate ABC transporter ATP-binding protein [Albitalea sp.]|nr:phosphate ABC transporter ATP-binding protein [Albitalea sp.]